MKKIFFYVTVFIMGLFIQCATVNAEDYSKIYSKITKDGTLCIDSFEPNNWKELDAIVQTKITKLIGVPGYTVFSNLYDNVSNNVPFAKNNDGSYDVEIELGKWDKDYNYTYEKYNLKVYIDSSKVNQSIKGELDQMATKIQSGEYYVEDIGLLNLLSTYKSEDGGILQSYLNKSLNYSVEYRKIIGNKNIESVNSELLGTSDSYFITSGGDLILYYNDIGYSYIPNINIVLKNIIYIPTDTENTNEAYMSAALKKMKSYLGRDDITIETYKKISDITDNPNYVDGVSPQQDYIDKDLVLDQYYNGYNNKMDMTYKVKIGNYEFYIMIEKKDIVLDATIPNIVDNITKVKIESNTLLPYDVRLKINPILSETSNYKRIQELIKKEFVAFDIKLYSNFVDGDIKKGNYRISIPIPDYLIDKELVVYYISDDNTYEEYPVSIENEYAVFTVDHLSTYILTQKSEPDEQDSIIAEENNQFNNPETVDELYLYIFALSISLVGLYLIIKQMKKSMF